MDAAPHETAFARIADSALSAADPPFDYPEYVGTRLRAPKEPLVVIPATFRVHGAGVTASRSLADTDADLTRQHDGEPHGQRIVVTGRVLGADGKPVRGQLVEIWQANAAGRYRHAVDTHDAPLDPNFAAAGRCLTDDDGTYRFDTVMPGAYPWKNHPTRGGPRHIHFSLFGRAFPERLVDADVLPRRPAVPVRPDLQLDPRRAGGAALVGRFELELTEPDWALGYRLDIVLGGREATPLEEPHDD